ncbi:MAG: hypothetical protein IT436_08655 [Phycisphaerales bacterium]|nr:hypothetical protein [Phycisphaerales bacterium]
MSPSKSLPITVVSLASLVGGASPARAGAGDGAESATGAWLLEPPAEPAAPATSPGPVRDLKLDTGPSDDSVSATLSFILWAPAISGDVTAGGTTVGIESSFIDTLQEADTVFGLDGRLDVGTRRFGGFVEGVYTDLGFDDRDSPAGNVSVSSEMAFVDFGLRYRVLERVLAAGDAAARPRRFGLDVYGGGRYAYLGIDFDFETSADVSKDKDWIDPIVGARGAIDLTERWRLTAGGDIGGFGAGSDFTWSAVGTLDYRFELGRTDAALTLGYKAIGEDYSDGSGAEEFVWDVILHGPIIAFTIRF